MSPVQQKTSKTQNFQENLVAIDFLVQKHQTELRLMQEHLKRHGLSTLELDGSLYLTEEDASCIDDFYRNLQVGWMISLLQRQANLMKEI
jgi:hypothetical protein